MQALTMTRLFAMVSRRSRSVPSTAGVWKDGARARQHLPHTRVVGLAKAPVFEDRLGFVPVGVAARRERLADTGGTEAQADVAVLAHGLGELDEAPVLPGDDERALARARRRGRHGPSSS
jgi:hypothetical protein